MNFMFSCRRYGTCLSRDVDMTSSTTNQHTASRDVDCYEGKYYIANTLLLSDGQDDVTSQRHVTNTDNRRHNKLNQTCSQTAHTHSKPLLDCDDIESTGTAAARDVMDVPEQIEMTSPPAAVLPCGCHGNDDECGFLARDIGKCTCTCRRAADQQQLRAAMYAAATLRIAPYYVIDGRHRPQHHVTGNSSARAQSTTDDVKQLLMRHADDVVPAGKAPLVGALSECCPLLEAPSSECNRYTLSNELKPVTTA